MMRKKTQCALVWAIAFFIAMPFFSAYGQSQENATVEDSGIASTGTAETAALQAEQKTVTAMEVKGNKAISTNTVLSKMKTKIGSPYNENIINDDLKRLYLLGFFGDISIDTEDYKNGIKVIVTVVERPIVEKIVFAGIKRLTLREEKIKEELKTKESQYLDYPSLNEDIETLKKLYAKRGYSEVDIEYKVDIDSATNKAKVLFNVTEGKRVRIKNIIVNGNSAFSDGRILRLMKTKRAWLFNAGILKDDVFKDDMERLKAFYQRAGYLDAAVSYDIKKDSRRLLLYITITIQEGKKYLVGSLAIKGNQDITEKEILGKLKEAVPGKVFSQEALKQDIANIQSLYFDRGYISMQIQEGVSLNAYTGRVDIVYTVRENDITYVDKIKIRGNVKTKDLVVRRELRIKPGDRFDGDKLRRSKERLQNLGFFDEISYDTQDTPAPEKKDLVVDVKETKTGAFSFGGGYSTVDEFIGFVEIEQKNFDWKNWPYFTGGGQDLRFRGEFGTVSSGFELGFTEPWMFDYPVSFGFDAYKRTHKRETDIGYGYDEDITGGDLRLGKEISEYVKANMAYRYDTIEITNISDDATSDLKSEYGKNTISSMELGLTFDTRDNVFDAHKGDVLSGSFQVAGGPFAGDKDFTKFYGRASHYFPFFRNSVLEVRGRLGLVDPYGDSSKVPIYERFFAGGAYSIRGYHERKIGPIDPVSKDPLGGESMVLGNLEYTYPLMDFLKVATFYDTGNVWSKVDDVGSGGFKSSTGFGFRIKTPIGPVSLDYGIPLNKEPGEDSKGSGRFHFSVSHGF